MRKKWKYSLYVWPVNVMSSTSDIEKKLYSKSFNGKPSSDVESKGEAGLSSFLKMWFISNKFYARLLPKK